MAKPIIIDLFAGAGGLSLGAARAGFVVAAAVETDAKALETHSINFPTTKHLDKDVAKLTGKELLVSAGLENKVLSGLIGGPPCQGFSTIGKRELSDERNNLFIHFFRLVKETSPKFFLAENVPGILDTSYDSLRETALSIVKNEYVILQPFSVSACDFGAPTTRTRVFYVGYKKSVESELTENSFLPPCEIEKVTVKLALKGLPVQIDPLWQTDESGWRKIGEMPKTAFTRKISSDIPDGIGNMESIYRYIERGEVSGCLGTRHRSDVAERYRCLAPGRKDKISKAIKLTPDGFCPTLRAGTGKDKGSFQAVRPIHPTEPRVITPREAARLQGFPDWFKFHGTKWHSFRQIGNSVSPIVAEELLSIIIKEIELCHTAMRE